MPFKPFLVLLLFVTATNNAAAQQPTAFSEGAQRTTMAQLFRQMPDSLLPSLSANTRLDMVDFMEAGMRAEVKNLLEGDSEMTLLTADSLSIRMSSVLQIDMELLSVEEPVDSSCQVIRVVRTYRINENQAASVVDMYSAAWRHLSSQPLSSSLLRRFDEVFSPEGHQR